MNNIDNIKNVYYINLDNRVDRKISIEKQLNELGWKYTRFPAIKHEIGALGCSMSHLKILELAKDRNLDYVVVIEDDALFTNIKLFKSQVNNVLKNKHEFDVLLLGGISRSSGEYISEYCIKISNCQTTIAYMVKKHFYDILIKNFKDGIKHLSNDTSFRGQRKYSCDIYWKQLQLKYMFLFLTPPTVTQLIGYSDIMKKRINYSKYMLNYPLSKKNKIKEKNIHK